MGFTDPWDDVLPPSFLVVTHLVLERLNFLLIHPQSVRFVIRSWFGWVVVVRSVLVELVLHVVFNLTEDVQDLVSVV